ncbi:MAG: hypothetical protein AAF802_21985 [Planctomycetota bacterium]
MGQAIDDAKLEFAAKNYHLAVKFSQYQLAREPEDFESLKIYGLASLATGQLDAGIEALEEATLIAPLEDDLRIELAIAYGWSGRFKLSCDLLMSIATRGNATVEQLLRIAAGLEYIDKPRLAMEACRRAGVLDPEHAEIHFQMGHYAEKCGVPDATIEALIRRALDLEPYNLSYRVGLASMLIRLGRKDEAADVLTLVVPQRLSEITCKACLKRFANLFFDRNRIDTSRLCAIRLAELEEQTPSRNQQSVLESPKQADHKGRTADRDVA